MKIIFCPSINIFCWSIKYTASSWKTGLCELHSHITPGNSKTCEVFPGQFMPDVGGYDVQMCACDLFACGETFMSGDPQLDRQSTHGARLGLGNFSSFTPLTASLFWLKASLEYLSKSRTSRLCFRHCSIIPKSTRGCGASTLCLISQGASSKVVCESRDERFWVGAVLELRQYLSLERAHCAYLGVSCSGRAVKVIAPKILGLFSFSS